MWYWLFRIVFICIFRLLFRFKVEGLENLPQKGNFIMAGNHISFLDPLVVMVAVPCKIHCVVLRNLYRIRGLGWFFNKMETLSEGSTSSQKATSLLTENKIVGLFPEGGISRDGKLREFRKGVALLALKTSRPVVPCAIFGTSKALPRTAKFPKFFQYIKVKIGKPIYLLKEFEDIIDDLLLQEGTFKIRNTIQEMLYAG